MSINLYQQSSPSDNYRYKLIQLSPDILDCIENNTKLTIKSPLSKDDLALVSDSQTWKIRQMDQTNTVLLMDNTQSENAMVGIASLPYEYELKPHKYSINTAILPVYNQSSDPPNSTVSLLQLIQNTPVSRAEFFEQWHELGGCEVNGTCYILPSDLISKILHSLLTVMIAEKIDYTKDSVPRAQLIEKLGPQMDPESVVNAVINKFYNGEDLIKVNNQQVAKWYGIQTLKQTRPMDSKQFYIEWKSRFPNFYHIPLDLDILRGHFYRKSGQIAYLNQDSLSNEISARIKELFKLSSEWDLNDMVPFITCLTSRKVESVLLKYSKIKRIGTRKVVCPR